MTFSGPSLPGLPQCATWEHMLSDKILSQTCCIVVILPMLVNLTNSVYPTVLALSSAIWR